jgi:CheY-like chemotaxis protein
VSLSEAPILVVDDTPENLLVLKLTFRVLNIELHQCLSAREAIDLCESIEFSSIAVCIYHNDDPAVVALSSDPAPSELRAAFWPPARTALNCPTATGFSVTQKR